ncbi:MAG TPA: Hsp20/alpha crystallin family protein [Synergistales bacterium]|nr:Hsp20/alpha crystallin family protein [Synergistaceae bacterium]HPA58338.1 Hsp20/alpha crystallin family protein [Synergistales bacterium]HQO83162.1 Hsp20/alpha crystallin family protein [Synergistales bacterium]HQQ10427.1 Hsp20/alpha crystallin family protein [Synergistales bacterium]
MRQMVPFGRGTNIFDEMDDIFRGFSDAIRPMTRRYVPVDMYEENDEVVLNIDAPGFDPSQIEIKTFSDRVDVRSNVEESSEGGNEGRTWYMRRGNRTMNLSVTLPTEVDPDRAQASFKNGVVTVRLPKSRAVQGRLLELKQE